MTTSPSRRFVPPFAILASTFVGACAHSNNDLAADTSTPVQPTPSLTEPFGVSTAALVSGPTAPEPPATFATNAALNLQSQILARASGMPSSAIGVGESGNVNQVSFAAEGADFDPDVSRDGRTIVFASTQHRPTADIYMKSVDGRTVTQLTNDPANDLMPRISPDGQRIAFASDRAGNWDIFVMPITGGKPIQITSSASHELHPSWSPDGSEIVFCRLGEVSGAWEMWVTSVSNPGVARFLGNGLFPEWCPVSGTGTSGADRIAFQRSRERGDRAFGIWVMDYKDGQAGNCTEMASLTTAACINPAWSPDGQWIAYATVPNPSQWSGECRPAWAELWMVDASGNNRVALTGGRFINLMPAWGPQNKLYFVSDRGGADNIWSMDTAKVVQLAAINSGGNTAVAGTPALPSSSPRTSPGASLRAKPITTVPETVPPTEH